MQLNVKQTILYKFESVNNAAAFFGVSPSTVYRWMQADKLPSWAYDKLQRNANGSLSDLGRVWNKWKINGDHLVSPNGVFIHIDQLDVFFHLLREEQKDHTPSTLKYMRERFKKTYYRR
ncbi:helix-turn-helix domain-containing protein [Photobacterium damselae]|uniref:helix-turn-helix domain-containing protein n=1 Tax=Photobacterium damselae TaxID=38293 RepID=UPI0005C4A3EC|nr:hypothetical protein BEI67_17515 [Photobacterium damselae subsp. piscicida]